MRILSAKSDTVRLSACEVLKKGGLVAIPTETVYGLAADATNSQAVARIYEAKSRPHFNPLIAHCDSLEMALRYGDFSKHALRCAETFWPGPLTIVMPYRSSSDISDLIRAGHQTVAIRIPKGVSAEVIKAYGKPLAAPSANLSGRLSPTTADHVERQLGKRVDLIIDDGACSMGLESTIVSFADDNPVLLRPGALNVELLNECIGQDLQATADNATIMAPGMLASHYAPLGRVRLQADDIRGEDGALNFGYSTLKAEHTLSLSETGDLAEAATNLFSHLAIFDERGVRKIAVAPIPDRGLGKAINDRLRRAAAPRS